MAEPDLKHLKPGRTGTAGLVVGEEHTAARIGSGRAPVLATPMLVALMERAAVACVEAALPAGQESLGVHIDVEHIAPTPIAMSVTATAELTEVSGRTLTFRIDARDDGGVVGRARHMRVVVDSKRFRAKALAKSAPPK
jgi:predicted thioesterase